MHQIQKVLLKRLLAQNKKRYSVLTSDYNYEDNVVFHLKQLLKDSLISKNDNFYSITTNGIKTITDLDLELLEDTGVKTFFIGFLCSCEGKYLVKEHPAAGENNFYNLPSGRPRFGEKIDDELVRTFSENTRIRLKASDFKYLSLHLKTVKNSLNEILFDDAFAVYEVRITKGQQEKMNLKSEIKWRTREEVAKLENRWPEIDSFILKNDLTSYSSYTIISNYIS